MLQESVFGVLGSGRATSNTPAWARRTSEHVARTSALEVRGSCLVTAASPLYRGAVSGLRHPFLSDRYFFVTVRLLKERTELKDGDFSLLALASNRVPALHPFFLTAWVLLPDHWHAICAPAFPLTISRVMKSLKTSAMILINCRRRESGELWQPRFFDRSLRTIKEYNEKVEYIDLNPVKAGLVRRPQEWTWSSLNEYSGMTAAEQRLHCGLIVDRVRMPSDPRTRL